MPASSCASQPAKPSAAKPAKPQAPALHEGPLTDFIPSAGLRWMVIGKPQQIAGEPDLRKAIELLLPEDRVDAFAKSSGVDLRTTPSALVAGFDYATLYVVATPENSNVVEERFTERLIAGPVLKTPHPRIRRVMGVVGETPECLVHIEDELVAVSVGSRLPAQVVELYARNKLKSPRAFAGSALKTLPVAEIEKAPARFYAPGPFQGDWAIQGHGLLATAVAVGIAARPLKTGRLEVTIYIAGDFAGAEGDPATRLNQAWAALASSDLGRLLGLDSPAAPPVVAGTPELLRLSVELELQPLASGLKAAVMSEVWEILDMKRPPAKPAP
jgi:hypothetical protein